MGGASNRLVSPLTDGIDGTEVSIGGKLLLVDAEWIVVQHEQSELWIPRDNVLLLRIYGR